MIVIGKTNNILNSSFFVFICGGLLGALFFIFIFGTAILDFTYTDWIMRGFYDVSTHHLGWKLFRDSAWYFPFGLMDNIVYPFKISIMYNDSIPLFAIIFKLLSPVLPEKFQYFGLFGILCYILQGGIGALIVKKTGGNTVQSIIGSMFFILSTVMMVRMFFHFPVLAHFILLLCILAYLENNNYSLKKRIFVWGGLLALSVSINSYFVPMVMIFLFFCLIREYTITRKIKKQLIAFGASLLILIGTMFCLGAFSFVTVRDASLEGLGVNSANLNTFINPQQFVLNVGDMPLALEGMSYFLKDMPLATTVQYEGYAYLGLGIILLGISVLFLSIQTMKKGRSDLKTCKKQQVLPIIGIVLSFLIFSLSPTVTFNQYKLFTYPVIKPVELLWASFRNTGRMIWPVVYIIMTVCIWQVIKQFSAKKSILVLCVFLLIQWADLKPWFVSKGNNYKTKVTWQSELSSPVWNDLANKYKHIFFMGDYVYFGNFKLHSFLDLAGDYKMTVNDFYIARKNTEMINDNKQKEAAYLLKYGPKNDMIYVFQDMDQASLYKDTGIYFYNIDDVIIGIDSNLP